MHSADVAPLPDLTPDCGACAALCCVALAFDEGEDFAIDKPAGLPCPHLAHHECTIYDRLHGEGFAGCERYDCQGAGQRTLAAHDGVSWRDDLEQLAPMLETFRHMRWIQDQIAVLDTAGALPLEDDEEADRQRYLAALADPDLTPGGAAALATGDLRREIPRFLRGLAHHV